MLKPKAVKVVKTVLAVVLVAAAIIFVGVLILGGVSPG